MSELADSTTRGQSADTPCVDPDAVFGVKESLMREFPVIDNAARAAETELPNPLRTVHFDVVLRPAGDSPVEHQEPVQP